MPTFDHRVSMHRLFYRTAKEHQTEYTRLDGELTEANARPVAEDDYETMAGEIEEQYSRREQAAVVAITLSAMCLEAFLFDYAAENLGKRYAEHLDRMDMVGRFVLTPKLVTGREIDTLRQPYEVVKALNANRNYLVHFKSKSFPMTELHLASDFHSELNDKLRDATSKSTLAVELALKEIDDLHAWPKGPRYFHSVCT